MTDFSIGRNTQPLSPDDGPSIPQPESRTPPHSPSTSTAHLGDIGPRPNSPDPIRSGSSRSSFIGRSHVATLRLEQALEKEQSRLDRVGGALVAGGTVLVGMGTLGLTSSTNPVIKGAGIAAVTAGGGMLVLGGTVFAHSANLEPKHLPAELRPPEEIEMLPSHPRADDVV